MRNTVNILGIPIDNVSMDEALNVVKGFLSEDRVHTVYTPNSEIMMAAQRDPELKKILCEADLLVPDGAGVVLASKSTAALSKKEWRVSTLQTCCFRTKPQKLSISFFSAANPGLRRKHTKTF